MAGLGLLGLCVSVNGRVVFFLVVVSDLWEALVHGRLLNGTGLGGVNGQEMVVRALNRRWRW